MKRFILFISLVLIGRIICSGPSSVPSDVFSEDFLSDSSLITLPDIDTSSSPNGIVSLPEKVHPIFRKTFVKYTKVIAPNGKPIHILAQDKWTDDQIKKVRNVLEFLLTPVPGSIYGSRKAEVANMMANRKATMILFNTVEDLRKAIHQFFLSEAESWRLIEKILKIKKINIKNSIEKIFSFLKKAKSSTFSELTQKKSLPEIVSYFLALLHLLEANQIEVFQKDLFGEIKIIIKE